MSNLKIVRADGTVEIIEASSIMLDDGSLLGGIDGEGQVTIAGEPGTVESRFQQFNDGTNGNEGAAISSGAVNFADANVELWTFIAPSDGNYTRFKFSLAEFGTHTMVYAVVTLNPGSLATANTKLDHDVDGADVDQGCTQVFPGETITGRSDNITSFAVAVVGASSAETGGFMASLKVGQ